jgi:hypothetical protein
MSKTASSLAALAVAAIALLAAAWFDGTVINEARRQAAAEFSFGSIGGLLSLGSIAVAGGCLLIGWFGVRAAVLVGLAYAVVGGFFALLPWLVLTLGAGNNDVPGAIPDAVASPMSEVYLRTLGPLNAVGIVGAAMLIAGLIGILRSLRRRDVEVPAGAPIAPASDPTRA